MDFRTRIHIPEVDFKIDHTSKMMLFGSCFSENIGIRLQQSKFNVDVNPFGILYNPMSVSSSIRRLWIKQSSQNLILYSVMKCIIALCIMVFSDTDKDICLKNISDRFNKASVFI